MNASPIPFCEPERDEPSPLLPRVVLRRDTAVEPPLFLPRVVLLFAPLLVAFLAMSFSVVCLNSNAQLTAASAYPRAINRAS
jgi:hypothetical protein